ncbi:alpha/beta hydrolase [Micromonospora sp. WMMC241]|uniref:alpha/beta hydrolase family protein n=1 Tax=Micromonospora sp. WMMC241 TaxID=3015159 RepID=UPI0022B5ECBE|nr:alpha/beta hydrolase [Micromonospora sp. WMMC241]MCZ7435621.1 alpha/beta hydrolase [Micromonospora sp. WMMC241]
MRGERLVAALTTALLAGCGPAVATSDPVPAAVRPAPERPYAVGMRQFTVDPDGPRPLPVTVWYPVDPPASPGRATGVPSRTAPGPAAESPSPGTVPAPPSSGPAVDSHSSGTVPTPPSSGPAVDVTSHAAPAPDRSGPGRPAVAPSLGTKTGPRVWAGAPVAAGRFPVVVYSHGLRSLPALHAPLTSRWAAAGLVVVAPTYPRTNRRARNFSRDDVRNQPADAWRLVRHLVGLSTRPGDPLGAHLAMDRLAAAGHSAGGHTTLGMFVSAPPVPLRAAIVIAGGRPVIGPVRPLAPVLFVHGTADKIVPQSIGRAAYARCLGPAAFLSLRGQGHGEYLGPGRPGFPEVLATTTDFLRWTLYGDRAALRRLPADATTPGVTAFTTRSFPA